MSQELINVIAAMLIYGVLHSLTAAIRVKAVIVALMGQRAYLGLYRLFYNSISAITLLPVLALIVAEPGRDVWSVDGAPALAFRALQLVGVLGVLISFIQIDALRFAGLRQVLAYLNGESLPLPPEPLSRGGVYGLVRHPLYFFSMLFLWFEPMMSAAWLGFCIGSTLYFLLGSLLEERKLHKAFGEDYAAYQREVAWMIPFVKRGG
jgi:protein-S-isoprenylcysteine O-methyltransferase Ste14